MAIVLLTGFVVLFVGVMALAVLSLVSLVEIARTPDSQFVAAGTEKRVWLLIVLLCANGIGAAIWWRAQRPAVRAAAPR